MIRPSTMKFLSAVFFTGTTILPVVTGFARLHHKSTLSQFLRVEIAQKSTGDFSGASWSNEEQYGCSTRLQMAFKTDEPTNMFDGPLALTKERDACGVGFIANTKSGGK